jgi:Icc-related predicted phosphoesterase
MIKKFIYLFILFSFIEFIPNTGSNLSTGSFINFQIKKTDENLGAIAVIGDLQRTSFLESLIFREQNDLERVHLINEISNENTAGVLILGDMVFDGSSQKDWRFFDTLIDPLKEKRLPIFPVVGNHEYWGNKLAAKNNLHQRFPKLQENHWYSFIHKNTAFIILDSNKDQYTNKKWDEQISWFKDVLLEYDLDPKINGILVFTHHPPFTNSTITGDEIDVQLAFIKHFNESTKTIAFISGHAHTYERFLKDDKTFIVSGGGGGPRVTLNTGPDFHKDLYDGPSPRPFHYLLINPLKENLQITVKGVDKGSSKFYLMEEITLSYRTMRTADN